MSADTPPDQKRRIYESLVYNLLYAPPPEGFAQAQRYAQDYLTNPANPPSPKLWADLAAAYGQEYASRKQQGESLDRLKIVRDNALHAVKEALRLEPRLKGYLRDMWQQSEFKSSEAENDLEAFKDDADFKALLE